MLYFLYSFSLLSTRYNDYLTPLAPVFEVKEAEKSLEIQHLGLDIIGRKLSV